MATVLSTHVPPVSGMVSEKAPLAPAVVECVVVVKLVSVLVAATVTLLPGAVVPVTVVESTTGV